VHKYVNATRWFAVVIASLVAALSFGMSYGIGNQAGYLVHGLRLYQPDLLAHDWLASETQCYHPAFARLSQLLYYIGNDSAWPFVLVNIAMLTAGGIALWFIVSELVEASLALPTYLIVLAWMQFSGTADVMGSYIFSSYLQPSTLGGVGFLAAIAAFQRGSYGWSGLWHALGGAFHANYLVLGFAVFGAAHLLLGRQSLGPRLWRQLAAPAMVLVAISPLILGAAFAEGGNRAREILFTIRSPHHYKPWLGKFTPFFAWQLIAGAMLLRIATSTAQWRRLSVIQASLVAVVVVGTLLTTTVYVPSVAQLFVWRLVPFCMVIAHIIVVYGVLRLIHTDASSKENWAMSAIAIASALMSGFERDLKIWLAGLIVTWVGFVEFQRTRTTRTRIATWAPLLVACAFWCIAIGMTLGKTQFDLRTISPVEEDLYIWSHTSPVESMFLVPPDMANFRIHARRAIVADWKMHPIDAQGILTWYERIEEISGMPGVRGLPAAVEGYAAMDASRLAKLRKKYDVDFLVIDKERGASQLQLDDAVFENEKYIVYKLKPETEGI
jgi:hypothetical protein